ncbi:PD-(D/E)XK nuclease family protein [Porphyromonas vaginalis]|uniref:PD-(D/E)XK nuclease family protein n=1 Tax=Porphyromonas vaginalis TaxID=3044325 RepID=UPI00262C8C11|nr:PD-(D/E)XK nuclease family protein [Porphyromonas vaginalis]
MKATDLTTSPIFFDPEVHEYLLIGRDFSTIAYSGVTSILSQVLFPNKYKDVDEDVLARAAARGTRIHELCQATDTRATEPREGDDQYVSEVTNYELLKLSNDITMVANEYLVSRDDWGIASQIDCVDSEGNLYDIKTTYRLDTEYVSWQLSFYAEMYEAQNPTLKAGKLYAIWLRGAECKLVEVPRKTPAQIQQVIDAWQADVTLTTADGDDIDRLVAIEEQIAILKDALSELEIKRTQALEPIRAKMDEDGVKSVDNPRIKITLVADSTSTRFDSKRFKADHSDLFAQYSTETTRAGYIKTTLI